MVLITSPMLKLAYEQSQSRFRSVFADPDGNGFSLPFKRAGKEYVVTVREHNRGLHVTLPCDLVDAQSGMAHADGTKAFFVLARGGPQLEMTVEQNNYLLVLNDDGTPEGINVLNILARVMNLLVTLDDRSIRILD